MQFTKLRLSGFKSFVEPTELWIEPGLTGIVGPNGCGKSNLVDGLRWAMGETSPRQMRGGEMDDVIFSGTAARPARNIAEVIIQLDNSDRRAPAAFNDSDSLEVSRRIDRGSGSTYNVNGKECRARDVHVLFADAATGARSTALVSQGHIGDLIKAKPADRRAILEEAAGITGLHSRRHEAELRLRAAETNLTRLDDIMATLETQLTGLKRQARQASRYRRIGDLIRRAEAALLHRRWEQASATIEAAARRLAEVESQVADLTARAAAATTAREEAAARLPDLRRAETDAAGRLQRLVIDREALDAEEARLAQARSDAESRIAQAEGDIARETQLSADAEAALTRIAEEERAITAAQEKEQESLEAATSELKTEEEHVAALETDLTVATERVAADEARRAALTNRVAECEARLARLAERAQAVARDMAALPDETGGRETLSRAESELGTARADLTARREAANAAQQALFAAQADEAKARDDLHEAEAAHARLDTEAATLAKLLSEGAEDVPPVIDQVTVEAGYELALAAALGDDLGAPVHATAPVRWEEFNLAASAAGLPQGAKPLADFVKAPRALSRRLAQIGVVESAGEAQTLRPSLREGQRLVTRDGAMWRWDGFTAATGQGAAAAERLNQRKRLKEIRARLPDAAKRLSEARARFAAAEAARQNAATALQEAQDSLRAAEETYEAARGGHDSLARETAAAASKRAGLEEAAADLKAQRAESESELAAARKEIEELPDTEAGRSALIAIQRRLAERRAALAQAQGRFERLDHEAESRRQRLAALKSEGESWRQRAADAAQTIESLHERLAAAKAEAESLAARPAEITRERGTLMDRIGEAESARNKAADELAVAETALAEADRKLKEAEQVLAAAREDRVRAQSLVEQAEQSRAALAERIAERLGCKPEETMEVAGIAPNAELPEISVLEAKLERLLRERDNMGPVNLRAETETEEIGAKIETLRTERGDLISAIARLRQGIASLNREGRERLLAAFGVVDKHFQELFTRLFGGGRAYMKLTEADDPLEAGLEIFASPPGKRLQVLSLLSGGEQALTALALLFAVFLTNPAPICVLDEVDAPLDDSNVDRFCTLIEEIAKSSDTRFLVVTHHRITMARVHRLFGVTMAEQGVSQLVSVDLGDAERLRATA